MEYKTEFITIYKIGYQIFDVPDEVYETICNETNEMIANNFKNCIPYNKFLAGNLSKEFQLIKSIPILNRYISLAAPIYFSNYDDEISKKKFKIDEIKQRPAVWVNFQQKGEMNPIHRHTGSLSFVMYIKIPYTIEDERNYSNTNYNNNDDPDDTTIGCFQFIFVDQYAPGGISTYTLPTDKKYEKKMILFAASLGHAVYPFFTSDEYRITVAGNIVIDE